MAQLFNVIGFRLETYDWIDFNEEREQERRRICDFVTTDRRDCPERKISATSREDQYKVHHGRIELDSHADTIVFGKNCVVLAFTGRECDVSPYTDTYDSIKSVPIAKAGTAWTSQSREPHLYWCLTKDFGWATRWITHWSIPTKCVFSAS